MRNDGRKNEQIRDIKIETDYTIHAEGSVLYRQGNTVVLCNASVEDRVPPHVFRYGTRLGDSRIFHAAAGNGDKKSSRCVKA